MKRNIYLTILLISLFCFGMVFSANANSKDFKKIMDNAPDILLNGVPVACDVDPYVMVPLSVLTSELGCTFDYDPETNTVNIYSV